MVQTITMKLWALLLLCGAAFGQQKVEFEVASIKPAAPMQMGMMRAGVNADAGMVRYTNLALRDLIRTAYRVKDFQVEGPDWISNARFDITAKLPDGASKDQIPEMLQALLVERFGLQVHRDSKEQAVYALVVGKGGPKLKPAEAETNDKAGPVKPPAPGGAVQLRDGGPAPRNAMMMAMGPEGAHLRAPAATLASIADMLSRFTERPVLDMTGIQGQYDFDFAFAPETMRGLPPMPRGPMGPGGPPPGAAGKPQADVPAERAGTIFDAVQQYGLKLERRKAPLEMIVVDHIEKTPTEN
jgi:uncharacterized protein (TIGR03435 family)